MAKKELRKKLKDHRNSLSCDERKRYSDEICNLILQSREYKDCKTVLSYFPINNEVDIVSVLNDSILSGKVLALPKVVGNEIEFYRVCSLNNLVASNMGIPEPCESEELLTQFDNSICIVPALGIDKYGYRIGYGGGYYDRFLKSYTGISIGVVYPTLYISSIPVEVHDIKLNMSVIPEKGIIRF